VNECAQVKKDPIFEHHPPMQANKGEKKLFNYLLFLLQNHDMKGCGIQKIPTGNAN
jgi:hypothetical protein